MSNEIGSSNQKPDAPFTKKQRVKLFLSSLHTWLIVAFMLIATFRLIYKPEYQDPFTWNLVYWLGSILITAKAGMIYYDYKKKTY